MWPNESIAYIASWLGIPTPNHQPLLFTGLDIFCPIIRGPRSVNSQIIIEVSDWFASSEVEPQLDHNNTFNGILVPSTECIKHKEAGYSEYRQWTSLLLFYTSDASLPSTNHKGLEETPGPEWKTS